MLGLHVGTLISLFLCILLEPVEGSLMQPCQPINQTVSLEKEGCPTCLVIQTPICSGHCVTKEPVFKSPFSTVYQHVCTYRDVHYETIRLPDCPPWVDPHVTYPVALSCDCSLCNMDTSDCTIESLLPDFCITQRALMDGNMW
ncbi:gonadotropin subunit beta-2 [Salmo trutta]|uniref:Luteinizing hormone subunit beta n=1 Tax=Salmo trutta TaxID=8032 RepID=A0A673VYB8_SALTR|nr:gonadotropin subunit beta-2 [Salmo trutta]XP_029621041.1 gonadotropin subunit beta-2 [Salmo trutta]XP_029621047.1 gonadotropin subunit beta-2 [Salmo trutta]XP_029621048.1 gonadotropin subunit beta-2 [Salmo trutta]